jgi:hypothetical protein
MCRSLVRLLVDAWTRACGCAKGRMAVQEGEELPLFITVRLM